MNRDRILGLIRQPETIDPETDMTLVKELIDVFPFYAAPHALLARLMYDEKSIYFDRHLRLGAAYIGSRDRLYDLLHGRQPDVAVLVEEEETEVTPVLQTPVPVKEPEVKVETPPIVEELGKVLEQEKTEGFVPAIEATPSVAEEQPEPVIEAIPAAEPVKEEEKPTPVQEEKKTVPIEIPSFASYDYFAYYDKVLKKADEQSGRPTLDLSVLPEEKKEKAQTVPIPDYTLPEKKEEPAETGSLSFSAWLGRLKTPTKTEDKPTQPSTKPGRPDAEKPDKNAKTPYKAVAVDDIISNFIAQEPRIKPKPSKFFSPEDMARQSAEQDTSLVTETLAEIYLQQGLTDKAIEIYRELSTRFPLKSSYFAAKIKEVKPQ
jgi:hypothetical protein